MVKTVVFFVSLALLSFTATAQKTEKKKNAPDEKITVKRE